MATRRVSFNFIGASDKGDPMSPFLFLLAMESLNHMFRIANTNRWVKGFNDQTGRCEDLEIPHPFYANDALIFVK